MNTLSIDYTFDYTFDYTTYADSEYTASDAADSAGEY